ncbi:AfsR/SARP family transcriptional regulator [Actinoplanes sichuanensis]|uniref:BTAD domain-containing putative transcriptional regulator n=1 Tax=Actinoplanes sichuanensis TaxID=512349 RepID=A0ABW4A3Z9_9ACTN|nr:BTAD domain-containing putative transcriptional regulator [Actinoplanes sichuanensis]
MSGVQMDAVSTTTRFAVLGPLRAWRDDEELHLGTPQQRALLAMLLVRAGSPVVLSEMIDVLWSHGAPATAVNVVQRYVSQLRRLLPDGALARSAGGYRLDVADTDVDLLMFRRLRSESGAAATQDPHRALELTVDALGHWRGPVAAGVDEAIRSAPMFVAVGNERTEAALHASRLALHVLAGDRVLPALRTVAAAAPLDEPVQAALVRVLAATGRQAEALTHFAGVRRLLAEELGVDPGAELIAAFNEVLRAEPAPAPPPDAVAVRSASVIRPAQLPADLRTFAGRSDWLRRLSSFLRASADTTTVAVAAISGMGGVGKTTLAVHSAHQLASAFPDGQLYANLRGFDPSVKRVPAQEVLRGFLGALGISDADIPSGVDEQVGLYRSMLAGRRMLVVLDNVRDSDHARPLLPGTPGSAAIVTSRDPLTGLVVREDALPVALDLLSPDEARALLARRLGRERTSQAYTEVTRVLHACGGLPLALSLFSARASSYPGQGLSRLADEVDDSRRRLDGFSRADAEHDLRAVFSWSYDLLSPDTARLFRLLALHPGAGFTVAAAASLLGTRPGHTDVLLRELCRAGLLTEHQPGRFRHHDLVRAYGTELLRDHEPEPARRAAGRRLIEHYARSLVGAAHLLYTLPPPPVVHERELDGVSCERFTDRRDAEAWLADERPALLVVIDRAAASGSDGLVVNMAWGLDPYLRRREHWPDWESTYLKALDAARRLGDQGVEAGICYTLGFIYCAQNLADADASEKYLQEALRLCAATGRHELQARVWMIVGEQRLRQDRPEEERAAMSAVVDLYRLVEAEDPGQVRPDFVAYAHWRLGALDDALAYALRAVDRLAGRGSYSEATAWQTLACIHADRGDQQAALTANARGCELYRQLGDEYLEGLAHADLGAVLLRTGQSGTARVVLGKAITILEALGSSKATEVRRMLAGLAAGQAG